MGLSRCPPSPSRRVRGILFCSLLLSFPPVLAIFASPGLPSRTGRGQETWLLGTPRQNPRASKSTPSGRVPCSALYSRPTSLVSVQHQDRTDETEPVIPSIPGNGKRGVTSVAVRQGRQSLRVDVQRSSTCQGDHVSRMAGGQPDRYGFLFLLMMFRWLCWICFTLGPQFVC